MFDKLTNKAVFSAEEIELISCAYKSQLKEIRHAIKTIELLETKSKFDKKRTSMQRYKNGLIYDLCNKGKDLVDSLEKYCVDAAAAPLTLILFFKMQADIYRYMAEHTQKFNDPFVPEEVLPQKYIDSCPESEREKLKSTPLKTIYKEEAMIHYKKARFISKRQADKIALQDSSGKPNEINSVQLGLGLNYAVFLWEIVQTPDQKKYALRHLKRIIQRALDDFDHWKDDEREKISQQVELIKENINQWMNEGINTDSDEEN